MSVYILGDVVTVSAYVSEVTDDALVLGLIGGCGISEGEEEFRSQGVDAPGRFKAPTLRRVLRMCCACRSRWLPRGGES